MSGPAPWLSAVPGAARENAVWRVDLALDETRRAACLAVLSEEERARAARFLRPDDRDRYVGSHAALRRILAAAFDTEASALRFRADAAGKPDLDGPWHGRLAFNLSHSGTVGLVGLTPSGRIGVDVEVMRPIADCLTLARSHFAPSEVAALQRLPSAALPPAFYACWTAKEAFVKALGLGLSFPLRRFAVAVPPEPAALLSIDGSARAACAWSLHRLDPAPGHAGAVAIAGMAAGLDLRSLEPGWESALA